MSGLVRFPYEVVYGYGTINMNIHMDSYVESVFHELIERTEESDEFDWLYSGFATERLARLFSTLHSALCKSFKSLNTRLPTKSGTSHFWAEPSRQLIYLIDIVNDLRGNLHGGGYSFEVDSYYAAVLSWCSSFLEETQGSEIPPDSKKITLPRTSPMFIPSEMPSVHEVTSAQRYELKLIGEGSYAKVFKYKDEYYGKLFAVKRAKEGLSAKDYERFNREYEVLQSLRSPYIIEVFRFDAEHREYVMEYIGCTLEKYIESHGNRLENRLRQSLAFQFLSAVQYLNDRGFLHRDLSPRNVLVKEYDDTVVVKLSDLGMAKVAESTLTSTNTEFRGSFNDPALRRDGFAKYGIEHEVYAATWLIFYIMTGRRSLERSAPPALEELVRIGTSDRIEERFKDIGALRAAFRQCCQKLGQ